MPIYEFQCQSCGTVFDRLQKMSDPDPTDCPTCKTPRIDRRVTAPSFRLAGSGWYETDFKKDGDKKRNIAGDGGEAKSEGSSEGKSEAKPDTKAEGKLEKKSESPGAPASTAPSTSSKPGSAAAS